MRTATKLYISLVTLLGVGAGLCSLWQFFAAPRPGPPLSAPVLVSLVVLCVLCRCLPLYVRENCTIDMSFISILATVLLAGPEAAVSIIFLTTPLVVIPTEDGAHYSHILNTAPSKTLFNMGNLNLSLFLGGLVYSAVGGVPGDIALPGALFPALLFIVVSLVVNTLIMMTLFSLEHMAKFYPTIFQMFFSLIPSLICSAPMGYFLVMLLKMPSGVWLALLFMLPLLLARFSFKLFLSAQRQQYSIVKSFAAVLEARDTYTEGHSSRVSEYAVLIARTMGLSAKRIQRLKTAGIFHDIGKVGIPDSILRKPGPLTSEERSVIQTHSVIGVDILKNLDSYQDILLLVRHHHEFFDGRGYPDGTRGDEVPLDVYILGAADAYDAITSDRPYCSGRSPEMAAAILREEAGRQFHPQVAETAARLAESGALVRCARAMEEARTC